MGEFRIPTAVNRVEFQQVRVHLGVADAIVDPGDFGTLLQQGFQRQFTHTAQAVYRVSGHFISSTGVLPMSSTAVCNAIRSRLSTGNEVNASIRRFSAP